MHYTIKFFCQNYQILLSLFQLLFKQTIQILIEGMGTFCLLITHYKPVRGIKLDPVSNSPVNCLISLTISPNMDPVCGKICGQIISSGRRDNLTTDFATNRLNIGNIVSENKQLTGCYSLHVSLNCGISVLLPRTSRYSLSRCL